MAAGRSPDAALTWASGSWAWSGWRRRWSATRTVPAAELVDQLTELAHGGLATLLPPR